MEFTLQQAVASDADELVAMHTAAHEECYAHVLPPEFFAERRASLPERIERRRDFLAGTANYHTGHGRSLPGLDDPRIIARDGQGKIVGFADAGPGRDADRPGELELYSIYTLASAYGTGLGAQLLNAAIGDEPAYLWVLEDNPRAMAFYTKHGFAPDGTKQVLPVEWRSLPEIRLVRGAK
ncbi:N-acetyltransferase family protein [Pseudarthrobacter sp. J1763]|uniref:GNAT family N-acetyltransferase n=1 Tax=Pseudarthrobacter sp. J1763 TaxID=3420445 RepID=UPI003D2B257B